MIVSNRGPAEFRREPGQERQARRGGGGLVTALTGLVARRDALWVASAMTDEDVAVAREAGGEPGRRLELDDTSYDVLMVESEPVAYDRFYNVIANPILWFVQHYLWDLSNAPDIRQRGGRRLGPRATRSSTGTSPTRCSGRSPRTPSRS